MGVCAYGWKVAQYGDGDRHVAPLTLGLETSFQGFQDQGSAGNTRSWFFFSSGSRSAMLLEESISLPMKLRKHSECSLLQENQPATSLPKSDR